MTLAGFTIRATDYSPDDGCAGYGMGTEGVVYLRGARECRVEGNRFLNIGKYAVCAVDSQGNRFTDNDVAHGAEGGILLIDSAGNEVSNNDLHHLGEIYKHVGGVILEGQGSSNNVVAHNLIHDTGGYSSVGGKPIFNSWGIYLDSFAGGYEVSHNIVYRNTHGGLMIQGGKDNHAWNNVFVEGQRQQVQLNNFQDNSTGNSFQRNVVYYTNPDAVLFAAYRNTPQVVEADYNLYYLAADKPEGLTKALAAWQKLGHDAHAVVADPCFVDPAHDDYSLRPESPAWKLGWKPIDRKRIGLERPRRTPAD